MIEKTNILRRKPMRIGAIQYSQRPDDAMRVPEILGKGKFNVEQLLHIVGEEVYGLYEKEKHNDILKEYIAKSTVCGIDIILYANVHIVRRKTFEKHPEWVQREKNGSEMKAYDTYVFACVNSEWRDSFFSDLKDSLDHDIKGVFLDGPVAAGNGCRCPICKKLFFEQFGHDMGSATRGEIRDFKTWSVTEFVKDTRAVVDASGRDIIIYCNSVGLAENVTGCDLDGIFPYVDFLGSEGGFMFYDDPNNTSIWRGSLCAKYLEAKSQGKPYVVFDAGNHQPWARYMHTAAETTILYANVVANGGNVWYGIHGLIDNFDSVAGETAFKFNTFLAENEDCFYGTKQHSEVALLWSRDTINCFSETVVESDFTRAETNINVSELGSFQSEFFGICDMLFRGHKQFSIIDETNVLRGDLSKFRTVILPNTICLDDKTIANIREYVKNGGNIIATLASGRCDSSGNMRKNPAFDDLFGIKTAGKDVVYKAGCGYLEIEVPFTSQVSDSMIAGFSTKVSRNQYNENVTVLASSFMPLEGRYAAFNEEKYPSIVESKFGDGNVVYIAGGIGQTYNEYGILDYKYIINSLIDRHMESDIVVSNAFPTVEVEMRLQDDKNRKLVHFVNFTGYMQRPIEGVVPCRDICVTIKTKKPVKKVASLFRKGEIDFVQNSDSITFKVDVIDYELVIIEM